MRLKKVLGCLLSLGMLLCPLSVQAEEDAGIVAYTLDNRIFTSMEEAWNVACGGTEVYLNKDWNVTWLLRVYEGNNATIDLNGHSITRVHSDYEDEGGAIYLYKNASLTLNGSIDRTFNFTDYSKGKNSSRVASATLGGIVTGGDNKNGAGGVQMEEGSTLTLNHVGIVGNRTTYLDAYGGGIQMNGNNCTVNINNGAMVSYNCTTVYGGGIYVAGEDGKINMDDGEVSFNSAVQGGGIYSNYDATYITMENTSAISNNVASAFGGGVYFMNSYNHIKSEDGTGKISKNEVISTEKESKVYGGGIYYASSFFKSNVSTLKGITLEANKVQGQEDSFGGAIYSDLNNVEITNCTFMRNEANKGAAVYLNGDKNKFVDCSLTYNVCGESGGAIYVDSENDVYFSGKCTVKENYKKSDNSANNVYLQNGSFTRAYVSGTPDAGSEIGLYGDGDCKVGINQTEDNGSYFLDQSSSYHLSYDDGKLYQKNGATGSIFGDGNTIIVAVVIVGVAIIGVVMYRKKKKA